MATSLTCVDDEWMVGMNPYKHNHFPEFDNCVEKQPTSSYQPAYGEDLKFLNLKFQ